MEKVLLIHPPFPCKFRGMPIGLVQIATSLKNEGYDVQLLDLNANPMCDKDFKTATTTYAPNYVGISSTSPSHLVACHYARLIKEVCNAVVVKGGVHETYCAKTTLQLHPEIDYSIIGDGEFTIVDFLNNFKQGKLERVEGIACRDKGKILLNGPKKLSKNLDIYPHANRKLLPPSDFYDFEVFDKQKTTQVRMSRGCFCDCIFCPVEKNIRFHSSDYVIEELKDVGDEGYKAVFWDDAIFTANEKLVKDILDKVIVEGLNFKMGCQVRADINVTSNILTSMRRAGFEYLSIGLETGDSSLLKSCDKRLLLSDIKKAVNMAHDLGFKTALSTIVGIPSETLESLIKTINFINELSPTFVSWSVFSFYPNSKLEFDSMWYEDPKLSNEAIWRKFDEGYGAKHCVSAEYTEKLWEEIKQRLDPKILI